MLFQFAMICSSYILVQCIAAIVRVMLCYVIGWIVHRVLKALQSLQISGTIYLTLYTMPEDLILSTITLKTSCHSPDFSHDALSWIWVITVYFGTLILIYKNDLGCLTMWHVQLIITQLNCFIYGTWRLCIYHIQEAHHWLVVRYLTLLVPRADISVFAHQAKSAASRYIGSSIDHN
jgi:hypothetical protein